MEMVFSDGATSSDPAVGLAYRADVGRFALESPTITEAAFVATFAPMFEGRPWPDGFACTAVDTATGEFRVWDASSNVPLERAIASSCSVPGVYPPITIDGARYMDGGARSALNADLAAEADAVIVVSVMIMELPPGFDDPRISAYLAAQRASVDSLRAAGGAVEVIVPDIEFMTLSSLGMNLMDFSLTPAAAEMGLRLGRLEAERLSSIW